MSANELNFSHENRRSFIHRMSSGIGTLALGSILTPGLLEATPPKSKNGSEWQGVIRKLHHAPKIKRVIHLCMAGGASHLETLDYQKKVAELGGKPRPTT